MADFASIGSIVEADLRRRGLDGLVNDDLGCACVLGDLFPCGSPAEGCEAGCKVPGCSSGCGEGCDFHVVPMAPADLSQIGLAVALEAARRLGIEQAAGYWRRRIESALEADRWSRAAAQGDVLCACGHIARLCSGAHKGCWRARGLEGPS